MVELVLISLSLIMANTLSDDNDDETRTIEVIWSIRF
jgi:hypothetical protein